MDSLKVDSKIYPNADMFINYDYAYLFPSLYNNFM
jgi:hypothetical protein